MSAFLTSLAPWHLDTWFDADYRFHQLYPEYIRQLARRHWTPLDVTHKAALFLAAETGARILDIGCGVGKFCLGAAYYKPGACYFGIEQRKNLVEHAEAARDRLGLDKIHFLHGNFTQLDLRNYDHFYFYNSFFENLVHSGKIDDSIAYDPGLYNYYSRYLRSQLDKMPPGTKVVTYCSWDDEIPPGYRLVETDIDNLLKCWEKQP